MAKLNGKKVLILGIGNILLEDEGFGVRAVEFLRENYLWPDNVELVDGGTRGLMLMSELMECDFAIILDIILGGEAKGVFYRLDEGNLQKSVSFRESMHQTGLQEILASCELAGHCPETIVCGMEPFSWGEMRPELSADAQRLLPKFCERVVEILKERGLEIGEKF